jgi:hypothetical protein
MAVTWPYAVADFVLLLAPDDLPERFKLRQGVEVVDSHLFLASLKRDVLRGAEGPRARWGALQKDLVTLKDLLVSKCDSRLGTLDFPLSAERTRVS